MARSAYWRGGRLWTRGSDATPPAVLSAAEAFPGLYVGWMGNAGKTVAGVDLTAWESTTGSIATPVSLAAPPLSSDYFFRSGSNYVQCTYAFGGVAGALDGVATGGVIESVDSDAYIGMCGVMTIFDPPCDFQLLLYDTTHVDQPYLCLGFLSGSAYALYLPVYESFDLSSPYILAQTPVALDEVFIVEMWSRGPLIKARINGVTMGSVAWSGQKWPATFDGIFPGAGVEQANESQGRMFEQLVVRGAYPGEAACAAWRRYCAREYGYGGA